MTMRSCDCQQCSNGKGHVAKRRSTTQWWMNRKLLPIARRPIVGVVRMLGNGFLFRYRLDDTSFGNAVHI